MRTFAVRLPRAKCVWLAAISIGFVLCGIACGGSDAAAATIRVFALGASNTAGKGVGPGEAWPAQLERLLRAKGYDATVTVNAISGDTSAGVLSRTSSIPSGTQVVVFDTGGDNDKLRGTATTEIHANMQRIMAAIRAHGATPVATSYGKVIGPQRAGGAGYQPDGIHLTAQSHARLAAHLVPQVIAAAKVSH